MDAVSATASVIAITHLAAQIANGIKTLYRFWESIEDAPQDVRNIMDELKLLECIMLDIGSTPINEQRVRHSK
jgi:hypothetical protein